MLLLLLLLLLLSDSPPSSDEQSEVLGEEGADALLAEDTTEARELQREDARLGECRKVALNTKFRLGLLTAALLATEFASSARADPDPDPDRDRVSCVVVVVAVTAAASSSVVSISAAARS